MKITWIGHSCFKIEERGYSVVFDPYADGSVPGLSPVREKASLVLCSHGHGDHNASENIQISGETDHPFRISKIETYHDDRKGSLRGLNTIHILETENCKIVHFGDIGCQLTPEQAGKLAGADLIMIPVGGFYTVDAKEAAQIVHDICPGLIIPMHYRKGGFGFDVIGEVEAFTQQFPDVKVVGGPHIMLEDEEKEKPGTVLVLTPANLK